MQRRVNENSQRPHSSKPWNWWIGWSHVRQGNSLSNPIAKDISQSSLRSARTFTCIGPFEAFTPKVFDPAEREVKGTACLAARIGLDRLNADLSQSANSQSPVLNLNIDLVSSLQVQCCVPRALRHHVLQFAQFPSFFFILGSFKPRFLLPNLWEIPTCPENSSWNHH